MAKDPATLWYWGDWFSGTTTLTRHLKGCYMDLLHAQFNAGHLSLEEIKTVLGSDFGSSWPTIQKKFIKDAYGLFFNVRAEQEKLKRQQYTQGRKDNLKKKPHMEPHMHSHMEEHMEGHMDNENKDLNGSKGKGAGKPSETKKFDQHPTADFQIDLSEMDIGVCQELLVYKMKVNLSAGEISDQFKVFKLTNFDGVQFYENEREIVKHFKNWLKLQKINNGKLQQQQHPGARPNSKTAGQDQLLANLHEQLKTFDSGEVYA